MKFIFIVCLAICLTACGDSSKLTKKQETTPTPSTDKASQPATPKEYALAEIMQSYPFTKEGVLVFKWTEAETDELKPYLPPHSTVMQAKVNTALKGLTSQFEPLVADFFMSLNKYGPTPKPEDLTQLVAKAAEITNLSTHTLSQLYQEMTPQRTVFESTPLSLKALAYLMQLRAETNRTFTSLTQENKTLETILKRTHEQQSSEFKHKFPYYGIDGLVDHIGGKTDYDKQLAKLSYLSVPHTAIETRVNHHFLQQTEATDNSELATALLSDAGALILNATLKQLDENGVTSSAIPLDAYTNSDELDLDEGSDEKDWFAKDYLIFLQNIFIKNPTIPTIGKDFLSTLSSKALRFKWNGKSITLKDATYYLAGEADPISDDDVLSLGVLVVDVLREDALFADVLKDPHTETSALKLSSKPTLAFLTPHLDRNIRLGHQKGCIDLTDLTHNHLRGTSSVLSTALPLSLKVSGDMRHCPLNYTGMYHIGNLGIGVTGAYALNPSTSNWMHAQSETALNLCYTTSTHWFIDTTVGHTTVQHMVVPNVSGTFHTLTLGYDAPWFTVFTGGTYRALSTPLKNTPISDYRLTLGVEVPVITLNNSAYTFSCQTTTTAAYVSNGTLACSTSLKSCLNLSSGISMRMDLNFSSDSNVKTELQISADW
jgi:hypothetical protein